MKNSENVLFLFHTWVSEKYGSELIQLWWWIITNKGKEKYKTRRRYGCVYSGHTFFTVGGGWFPWRPICSNCSTAYPLAIHRGDSSFCILEWKQWCHWLITISNHYFRFTNVTWPFVTVSGHFFFSAQIILLWKTITKTRDIFFKDNKPINILFLVSRGAGGFWEAQLVRMALLPIHWPFIEMIAFSASCTKRGQITFRKKVKYEYITFFHYLIRVSHINLVLYMSLDLVTAPSVRVVIGARKDFPC